MVFSGGKSAPDYFGAVHSHGLTALPVERACLATWAELLHLKTIWIVTAILLCDVVALFAIHAGHGDFGADIRALTGH